MRRIGVAFDRFLDYAGAFGGAVAALGARRFGFALSSWALATPKGKTRRTPLFA